MTLVKKLILTALLSNIAEALFRTRTRNIVQAQLDTPTPDLEPDPGTAMTVITNLDTAYQTRETLTDLLLKNTEEILKLKKKINDIIVDNWMPDVQLFCNGDAALAKQLGYGIKGEYDGKAESSASVTNSFPSIINVVTGLHLQATIEMENSLSKEIIVPPDAKGIDIYVSSGSDEPMGDYKKTMHYDGRAKRGKYTVHFTEDEVGQYRWVLAAYVPKNAGDANMLYSKIRVMVI